MKKEEMLKNNKSKMKTNWNVAIIIFWNWSIRYPVMNITQVMLYAISAHNMLQLQMVFTIVTNVIQTTVMNIALKDWQNKQKSLKHPIDNWVSKAALSTESRQKQNANKAINYTLQVTMNTKLHQDFANNASKVSQPSQNFTIALNVVSNSAIINVFQMQVKIYNNEITRFV